MLHNLFLCRTYPYNRLMCIQDSRRSYRTYAYATKFNLFGGTCRYHRDYGTYTGISDTKVPVGTTEHFTGTKVPVGATEQIPYTEVLVGTTRLILILWIREYS